MLRARLRKVTTSFRLVDHSNPISGAMMAPASATEDGRYMLIAIFPPDNVSPSPPDCLHTRLSAPREGSCRMEEAPNTGPVQIHPATPQSDRQRFAPIPDG